MSTTVVPPLEEYAVIIGGTIDDAGPGRLSWFHSIEKENR